jgi:hypothetical protein
MATRGTLADKIEESLLNDGLNMVPGGGFSRYPIPSNDSSHRVA